MAGGGKSTLVTVVRFLLCEVLSAGSAEEISIDDFLSSGPADEGSDRARFGIRTRWDVHSTDGDLGLSCLRAMRKSGPGDKVELPCFQLAKDVRKTETRVITGPVDFILFEGWRVGVHHPNFFAMNGEVDTLVYLDSDFASNLNFKKEKIKRDIAASGYDLYRLIQEKYSLDVDAVFEKHYFAVARRYILPVMQHSDIVLKKDANHHIEAVRWQTGRWAAQRARQIVEEAEVAIVSEPGTAMPPALGSQGRQCVELEASGEGAKKVLELTRGWAGHWVAELAGGSWVRAPIVVCGPLSAPRAWAEQLAAPRGGGCPWDGLPSSASRHTSGERQKLEELEAGAVLVLGLATADGYDEVVSACAAAGHPVYLAQAPC
jgi:uridine kinase